VLEEKISHEYAPCSTASSGDQVWIRHIDAS
jgi:hypothetical protein